jgi:propionyl-CoA synthetase
MKRIGIVPRLPKARSGKILRSTVRRLADSEPFQIPATIDEHAVLQGIREALQSLGYARESGSRIGEPG